MSKQLKCKTLSIELNSARTNDMLVKADGVPIGNITRISLEAHAEALVYVLNIDEDNEPLVIDIGNARVATQLKSLIIGGVK